MAGFFSKLLKRSAAEVEPPTPPSGDPFDMDWGSGHPTDAVVYQLTSVLMHYPSEEARALLPEFTALAQETGNDYLMRGVARIKNWYETTELDAMQAEYVQEYDLSRRHAFHLSYWTEGDTRRRGEALARFKQMYRDSGMVTTLHGELPDYLPMVLEFTALVDARAGRAALQAYRPSLELLRLALRDDKLPYYELIEAVCQTLPGVSPKPRRTCKNWSPQARLQKPSAWPWPPATPACYPFCCPTNRHPAPPSVPTIRTEPPCDRHS